MSDMKKPVKPMRIILTFSLKKADKQDAADTNIKTLNVA